MLEPLSALRALSKFLALPYSSVIFALVATPNNVPAVSNKLTKRKDIITLSIAISKAPKISIFISVGAILGGIDTKPPNSTNSRNIEHTVISITPIRIAPGIFLTDKEQIIRKPKAANNVSIFVKSPKLRKVASLETINPPFFNPIKPIKSPTPAPIAIRRFRGILSSIHLLNLVTLIMKNKTPAKKTAPRATSHEYPISPTTV